MIVGVVISNILYLAVALVVAILGALVVVLRHRKPKSVEANVASFHRGLRALAPDRPTGSSGSGPSWGGASRRTVTTPSAFKRQATSGGDAPEDPPTASADDEGQADLAEAGEVIEGDDVAAAGPGEADAEGEAESDAEAVAGKDGHDQLTPDAVSASEESEDAEAEMTEAPPAVDPVHLTSRMRRPPSGSSSRASDASEVSTKEAGTG